MAANERLYAEFRSNFECNELKVTLEAEPSVFVVSSTLGSTRITVSAGKPVSRVAAELILTVVTRSEVTGRPARALQELWERSIPAVEDELPQYLRDLLAEVDASAQETANRVIRLYQWRWGGQVRTQPRVQQVASEFSVVAGDWRAMPRMGTISLVKGRPHLARVLAEHRPGVDQLLQADLVIPLGHELLAEAEDIWATAPRSSLILSISALEVGFKGMVTNLVPDAEWLVSELPSPPIVRLLQDYLPKLPRRGRASTHEPEHISDKVISEVRKAVSIRNRLAHQGKASIEKEWLSEWLILCGNLLYLFDFYAGQPWALQQIRPSNIRMIIQ